MGKGPIVFVTIGGEKSITRKRPDLFKDRREVFREKCVIRYGVNELLVRYDDDRACRSRKAVDRATFLCELVDSIQWQVVVQLR